MSKKCRAKARFRGRAKRTGYSNRTRQNRMNIIASFVEDAYGPLAYPIDGPEDVEPELLQRWVDYLVPINSPRTIQNKLSTVRRVLEVSGFEALAGSDALRSRALGAPQGSRDGTNVAITSDEYARVIRIARKLDEPGLVPALQLQRLIGLRRQEAVMAGPWLEVWERRLLLALPLPIRDGTKNKRPRDVEIPDRAATLEAVRAARVVADAQGGHLIAKPTLKEALARYSNLMHEWVGVKGHSLRYAFAKDLYFHLRARGLSEDEAWPLVSDALGHGLNREDLMRCVYLKDVIPRKTRAHKRKRH